METEKTFSPVLIEPKNVYGIRPEVRGNIQFNLNQEVIYPVEGVLAFHDYVNNKQRFLRLPGGAAPTNICVNSTRLLMGVVEIYKDDPTGSQTSISIYDLVSLKKIKNLQLPEHIQHKKIKQITFTCDSKAIVALTEYPEEMLCMLFFDRQGTIVEGRVGNSNRKGMANFISGNPLNPDLIVVAGENFMKVVIRSEKTFSVQANISPDFNSTTVVWISSEVFVVGTFEGLLIFYQNAKKLKTYRGKDVEFIDLGTDTDVEYSLNEENQKPPDPNSSKEAIVCMRAFSKGIAFAVFNQVIVFEKVSKTKYERKTILHIEMNNYPEPLYQILNMAINLKQDTVIVTPKHSQIYVGILIVPESLETKYLEFRTLGELLHIDEIYDVGLCTWRPIIITSSKDRTIRIWNYGTGKVELVKTFTVDVTVIELYASGQYAAVGFTDRVKIMKIFMDDMTAIKTYDFTNSRDIKFSNLGHLMATAYDNEIAINSLFSLEILITLKGHTGTVLSLVWARNDKSVISCGADGAVYQWDINTGTRLQEVIHPGVEYHALCVPNDPECIYAATNTGIIREIRNSKVTYEIKMPTNSLLKDISLSRSDLIMFAATEAGQLYNVQMPLSGKGGGSLTPYSFFGSAITKLRFTFDGTFLISSSASGTLVIWQLKNIEGLVAPIDQDLLKSQEVLIPRRELEAKLDKINALETHLKKQAAEFYKKQSQNEENEQQQLADTHKGYCEALKELNAKNEEIGIRHAEEIQQVTAQIDELKVEHKITMDRLSAQYSDRMAMEYQKFNVLRESILQIRESYEKKLKNSEECLRDTIAAMEQDYNKQLSERQEIIRQLMVEIEDTKFEFREICRKGEIDYDRKMIDSQIAYNEQVQFEIDETNKWKEKANLYKEKYDNVKNECENLIEDVEQLREEHFKTKSIIEGLRRDISDLHNDVADRENIINQKEKRIDEMLLKNEELAKYKQVLHHKINELKAQIEPRELTIIEKRKQITEMEQELTGLQKNNAHLELQLKELKDKCISINVELKLERTRAKSAQLCFTQMCIEIYQLSKQMTYVEDMKEAIKNLFLKYSNEDALKKFTLHDAPEQADLLRQRAHIEKIMLGCKQKVEDKTLHGGSKKLAKDNRILKEELFKLREQEQNLANEIEDLKIINILRKSKLNRKPEESEDSLVKFEKIESYFTNKIANLKAEVERLTTKNEKCKKEQE